MRIWPANVSSAGNSHYGTSLRYDIAFQTAGNYKLFVRGRPCIGCNTTVGGPGCDTGCAPDPGGPDSTLHYLQSNSSGLYFSSNGNPVTNLKTPWTWKNFTTTFPVSAAEIGWPPILKSIYLAQDDDGVVIDKVLITINVNLANVYGGTDIGDPASPFINCDNGELLYIPSQGYFGTDTFQYIATNGQQSSTANVTVYVGVTSPSPSVTPSSPMIIKYSKGNL